MDRIVTIRDKKNKLIKLLEIIYSIADEAHFSFNPDSIHITCNDAGKTSLLEIKLKKGYFDSYVATQSFDAFLNVSRVLSVIKICDNLIKMDIGDGIKIEGRGVINVEQ